MHFELPESSREELTPFIQKELGKASVDTWMVSLEKLEALVEGDEGLQELLEDVLDQCLRYTKSVVEDLDAKAREGFGEEAEEKGKMRTRTHEATQDTIRAFVRNLVKAGKTPDQMYPLLPNPESRPACGYFALKLTLTRGAQIIK